jgi:DNA modification methylase
MKLGEFELNQIYTGDARELSKGIPDESIDLIFTDPPYPKEYLQLYEWLGCEAKRILKPGGLCLAMAGQSYLDQIYAMMSKSLSYHWTFCLEMAGSTCAIWKKKISTSWKPIVCYVKEAYSGTWIKMDRIPSVYRDKRFHVWGQNENACQFFINLTNGIIFEPFCGGGTVPVICKQLKRNYLAFEIDEKTANIARQRIQETPEMLPLIYPDSYQGRLFVETETPANNRLQPTKRARRNRSNINSNLRPLVG